MNEGRDYYPGLFLWESVAFFVIRGALHGNVLGAAPM